MISKGRRGHGEDSIYRDADRWRGVISRGRGPNGSRLRTKVSGRTKAEVIEKLKEAHRKLDAGIEKPTSRLTVGQYLDRWVQGLAARVEPTTAAGYAATVRLHLRPALGHKPLKDLSVSDLDALWAAKQKKGYKPNSVRIMRAVLRSALRQAEKEGLILRNVASLSSPQKLHQPDGRSLSVEQARRLLDAATGDRLQGLYVLTLLLGLRRGEALGLAWQDINLDTGIVQVRRQVRRVPTETAPGSQGTRSQLVIKDLKTKKSRRDLYLTDSLSVMLRTHQARQAEEQLAAGPNWTDSGLVFTTPMGTPLDPDNFGHYFGRLCTKAEIGRWHLHELRHSAASLMLSQGTPLHVVSEVLGHSSIAITKDVYGHLIGGEKQAAVAAISAALL